MDRNLRRLQRLVQADPADLQAAHTYIAALERAVGGVDTVDHPYLDDACIASAYIPDREIENEIYQDLDLLNAYSIDGDDGNRQGIVVDIYWDERYEGAAEIEGIESQLSESTKQLLMDASNLGYKLIVFWR